MSVEGASSPVFEGAKQIQTIWFQGNTMTLTGSKVDTPEGPMSPVNVWKKCRRNSQLSDPSRRGIEAARVGGLVISSVRLRPFRHRGETRASVDVPLWHKVKAV